MSRKGNKGTEEIMNNNLEVSGERNSQTVTREGMKTCASEENDNTFQPLKSFLCNVNEVCVTASEHPSVCVRVCV